MINRLMKLAEEEKELNPNELGMPEYSKQVHAKEKGSEGFEPFLIKELDKKLGSKAIEEIAMESVANAHGDIKEDVKAEITISVIVKLNGKEVVNTEYDSKL